MINARQAVEAGDTPEKISISMIDQDLKDGITKAEMSIKYGIKPWEVDEMFKHELLKGRRPARKRILSFTFVDDMSEPPLVDPNQVTLEDAIDEAIEAVEEVKTQMQETQEAILDILSPTEYETEVTGIPKGTTAEFISEVYEEEDDMTPPTIKDTLDLIEDQEMESTDELDMDDTTFEL